MREGGASLRERVWHKKRARKLWHADRRRECGCTEKKKNKIEKGKSKLACGKTCPKFIDENKVKWRERAKPNQVRLRLQHFLGAPISLSHVGPSCVYEL